MKRSKAYRAGGRQDRRGQALRPARGRPPGQGDLHHQVRRDRRGRHAAGRRPAQGRPDGPRHRQPAARHRQDRPRPRLRHRRQGRGRPCGRCRLRRLRRPDRARSPAAALDFDCRRRDAGPDGQGRPPRQGPRPPWPHAEPEDRHRHHGRRQGRHRHQGRQDRVPRRQARQPALHHRQDLLRREVSWSRTTPPPSTRSCGSSRPPPRAATSARSPCPPRWAPASRWTRTAPATCWSRRPPRPEPSAHPRASPLPLRGRRARAIGSRRAARRYSCDPAEDRLVVARAASRRPKVPAGPGDPRRRSSDRIPSVLPCSPRAPCAGAFLVSGPRSPVPAWSPRHTEGRPMAKSDKAAAIAELTGEVPQLRRGRAHRVPRARP